MSTKNIYLFKVSIRDTQTNTEVPVQLFRGLLREILIEKAGIMRSN